MPQIAGGLEGKGSSHPEMVVIGERGQLTEVFSSSKEDGVAFTSISMVSEIWLLVAMINGDYDRVLVWNAEWLMK